MLTKEFEHAITNTQRVKSEVNRVFAKVFISAIVVLVVVAIAAAPTVIIFNKLVDKERYVLAVLALIVCIALTASAGVTFLPIDMLWEWMNA